MGWVIGLSLLAAVLLLFPFTSLWIHVAYRRSGEDDQLTLRFLWLWGLIRFRYRVPMEDISRKGLNVREKMDTNARDKGKTLRDRINWAAVKRARKQWAFLRENIVYLTGVIRRFLSRIVCERFTWYTEIGTGDAAETGVVTGLVWGIKSSFIGVAGSHIRWDRSPDIDVEPRFNEKLLHTDLDCIIRFRIGYAILAVIRLFTRMRRKGSEGKWQNTLSKA
ncbi:DUF2953 domain-containing protein [Paludifilum halophilum]|nr:DUF2953 domain-containing protein [Paludifilum halophilum]